jgi:tRNA(Ile)-lysidine synthase TilS/MesJ
MNLFFRCKNCLFPSTKPDLHFNEEGVCMACKYTDYYKNIDWDKRKKDFFDLIDKFKSTNKNNNYDCTIAVSGGKDSTYQTHLIKEAGLKPLLLNFEPSCPTKIGKENLQNLVDTFGLKDWQQVVLM